MKQIKKATSWVRDYFYAICKHIFVYKPIENSLLKIKKNKAPIILIPGLFEKHNFLENISDALSLLGHPIYTVDSLGRNTKTIKDSAKLVDSLIKEKKLENIIILAHSKGGLIGKYVLAFNNKNDRIKKLITIATPWEGSWLFKLYLHKSFKELRPNSEIIEELRKHEEVNNKIVSIFGKSDNVILPVKSCRLNGAKNIKVNIHGHHKILFDKKVQEIVISEIDKI